MGRVLLRAIGVSKSFAGVQALSAATFELRAGEVHALIGENGAGKSTLIRIITGAVQPDDGVVELDGAPITHNSPARARALGIAAIYQQPALFAELSVAENIALVLEPPKQWGRVDWRGRRRRAQELLGRIGAHIDPDAEAGELSMPEQQLVEIARALGADARVLILDEPTASLSEEDARRLFRVIHDLRGHGVGVIYISHRLEELRLIADRVTVLRDGRTVGTRAISEAANADLIRMMVGRELSAVYPSKAGHTDSGETILELRGLGCTLNGVHDVDLTVRAGEIVGLAGLVGAGRTELARTIFGLDPADRGEIRLRGCPLRITTPSQAIAHGIAYVPEDRRRHGVVLEMAIGANITLASLDRLSHLGVLDTAQERDAAVDFTNRLRIRTPSIHSAVSTLSGGNQQKVALSRWLLTRPSLLILDEPTQGVDVGAKAEIHSIIADLAAEGVAILMISSELPEILGMSDRIAVMHAGTIVGVVNRSDATQESILALALGHGSGNAEAAPAEAS